MGVSHGNEISSEKKKENISNGLINSIKSSFILKKVILNLSEIKKLDLIIYNKKLQKTLGLKIEHYKKKVENI